MTSRTEDYGSLDPRRGRSVPNERPAEPSILRRKTFFYYISTLYRIEHFNVVYRGSPKSLAFQLEIGIWGIE